MSRMGTFSVGSATCTLGISNARGVGGGNTNVLSGMRT
jgi:hypothetical protein